jgi:Ca-activated chloride channel family protein
MYRFEHKEFLYWLMVLIPITLIFIYYLISSKNKRKKLGDETLVKQHIPDYFPLIKWLKFFLIIISITSLIFGLANLQTFSGSHEVKVKGSDIMICLDISNSMLAQDLTPNRLERAKMALQKMIDNLQGDKIGIIVFAGDAFVLLPMTVDYNAAKIFVQSINTKMISTQGTNISAALQKALESFENGSNVANNKVVILITDGEDHDGNALEIAKLFSEKNIPIHCIGIGSEQGAPIPVYENNRMIGYKKDKDGNTVITKLNKEILHELSSQTNGLVVIASNTDFGLNTLLKEIKKLNKSETDTLTFNDYESQYQWFIGLALFLLIIEFLITESKPHWIKNLSNWIKI